MALSLAAMPPSSYRSTTVAFDGPTDTLALPCDERGGGRVVHGGQAPFVGCLIIIFLYAAVVARILRSIAIYYSCLLYTSDAADE